MSPQRELTGFPAEPITRGPLQPQMTSRLMRGIFLGHYRTGQRLVVQNLAEAYQASPTPVREAPVELLLNRGAVVQPFGPQEIREISQIRRLLEVEAARCTCGRMPSAKLSAVE